MSKGLANELKEAAESDLLTFKFCYGCSKSLTLNCFSNNRSKADGKATQCKECLKAYVRNRRASDEDFRLRLNTYQSKWSANDPKRFERKAKWASLNKDKLNAKAARRRAKQRSAAPTWLDQDHRKQIEDIYWLAQDLKAVTGEDYHVDHIVPLMGKEVCGLHVPWNLQILPADLNLKKSNG